MEADARAVVRVHLAIATKSSSRRGGLTSRGSRGRSEFSAAAGSATSPIAMSDSTAVGRGSRETTPTRSSASLNGLNGDEWMVLTRHLQRQGLIVAASGRTLRGRVS
jgi:hypothetical protein